MNYGNARFVHIRNANQKGYTAAYEFDDDNKCINYALAKCGKKDSFNRKVGRAVSYGRLRNGSTQSVPYSTIGEKISYQAIAGYFYGALSDASLG